MKKNVWQSIEQRTIDTSIDQWHSRVKTRMCAEGEHFKHRRKLAHAKIVSRMNIYHK